jgi:hypothetical protein
MLYKYHVSISFILAAMVLVVVISACHGTGQIDQPTSRLTGVPMITSKPLPAETSTASSARLRIKNSGNDDIENLVVLFPDERIEFGSVPAGATTEYQPTPGGVYNYAAYEYTHLGQTVTQPVIDWVGETPQDKGNFTYVLSYQPDEPNMMRIILEGVEQP